MTNDERNPNDKIRIRAGATFFTQLSVSVIPSGFGIRISDLIRHSSFVIRHL